MDEDRTVQLASLLVKQFEGYRELAYQDSAGVWTVGWGQTGKGVGPGIRTTPEAADAWLKDRLRWLCKRIDHDSGRDLNSHQLAALLSFAYNVGLAALERSTLWGHVQAGQWLPAADQFHMWDKTTLPSGAKTTLPGLTKRRLAERALFLAPV